MRKFILVIELQLAFLSSFSQEKKEYAEAIEDNSYLIEEAYNQEAKIVQHISNGYFKGNDFLYSFTQEWPVAGVKHQLSYTIPYSFINSNSINGVGDVLINYRYQILYKEKWACVAPRVSIVLPTGNYKKEFGMGAWGVQFNLPVSKRISNHFVLHMNAGSTLYINAKYPMITGDDGKKNLSLYNIGGSIIWLAKSKFNFMLECLENFNSSFDINGNILHTNETILNPGVRFAIDIKNLQIVPGISAPITFTGNNYQTSFFAYLSFEHPF